jgi:23S rRNA (guanosine2251-2'-O)-methyltransferase
LSQIEGRRPVLEALKAGREISELLIASGAHVGGALAEIASLAQRNRIPVRELPRRELESRAETRNPQGVIALTQAYSYSTLDELLAAPVAQTPALYLALDGVTDPQNLGALARSAEAAGAAGLIVPKRRAAGVTASAEKASSGALEHLPVAQVTNLVRSIEAMKERDIWVLGLDSSAEKTIYDADVSSDAVCIVVGGEGAGLSRLVRERVDEVVSIPMRGRIGSLNASAAGAVAIFEIRRQQR